MPDERRDHWLVAKILLEDTTDEEAAAYADAIEGHTYSALSQGIMGEVVTAEEAPTCNARVNGPGEDHPCRLYAGHPGDHA